jgi:hypothetical protein
MTKNEEIPFADKSRIRFVFEKSRTMSDLMLRHGLNEENRMRAMQRLLIQNSMGMKSGKFIGDIWSIMNITFNRNGKSEYSISNHCVFEESAVKSAGCSTRK